MRENDAVYFYRRAEAELEQAKQATKPEVVRAHFMLANAYLERVSEAEAASTVAHG